MQILIIGGDARNRHLAALARAHGHVVQLVGHNEIPLLEAKPSGCVVMPFPTSEQDGSAPAPLSAERLEMPPLCALLEPGATVFASRPGPILSEYILKKGCIRIDFFDSEAFMIRNAVPSAEGAIHALMGRSELCVDGSQSLVIGYGRLGRALALRLRGLGAQVTVAARSAVARAAAESDGCRAIPLSQIREEYAFRFLLNTVPAPVVGRQELLALPRGALAVDLASAPYGIDLEAAWALGVEAWRELSIPGRYAPETAAAAMLACIEESAKGA